MMQNLKIKDNTSIRNKNKCMENCVIAQYHKCLVGKEAKIFT